MNHLTGHQLVLPHAGNQSGQRAAKVPEAGESIEVRQREVSGFCASGEFKYEAVESLG